MPVLSKKGSSKVCGWICSIWPSWVWESQHASTGYSVSWSLGHSSRSSFHRMAFFPSLKQDFFAYRSSKVSDCIFEIPQLWQSGFSRVYSNCCCSYSFEAKIIKIGRSSHKIYSNNIMNFQETTTILNACTKKVWKLIEGTTYILKITIICTHYHNIHIITKPQIIKFINKIMPTIIDNTILRIIITINLTITIITTYHQTY